MIVYVITDRLNPTIAGRRAAETVPRLSAQYVWQAEAARKREDQRCVRKLIGSQLGSFLIDILDRVRHHDARAIVDHRTPGSDDQATAGIAVEVWICASRNIGLQRPTRIDHVNFLITQRLDLEHGGSIDVGLMHELATNRETPGHRDQPILF